MGRLRKTAIAVGIGAAVLTVDYIVAAYELYHEKHGPRMNAICKTWCKCKCNKSACGCHIGPPPKPKTKDVVEFMRRHHDWDGGYL